MGELIETGAQKVLLIVEDQLLLAMGFKDELEDCGYRVLELAIHNSEALRFALAVKPDLALVNIELADGDDGVALAGDLKAMGIPVLFISGQPARQVGEGGGFRLDRQAIQPVGVGCVGRLSISPRAR
jgi:CheY-like chemotaxis protein